MCGYVIKYMHVNMLSIFIHTHTHTLSCVYVHACIKSKWDIDKCLSWFQCNISKDLGTYVCFCVCVHVLAAYVNMCIVLVFFLSSPLPLLLKFLRKKLFLICPRLLGLIVMQNYDYWLMFDLNLGIDPS